MECLGKRTFGMWLSCAFYPLNFLILSRTIVSLMTLKYIFANATLQREPTFGGLSSGTLRISENRLYSTVWCGRG